MIVRTTLAILICAGIIALAIGIVFLIVIAVHWSPMGAIIIILGIPTLTITLAISYLLADGILKYRRTQS